MRMPKPKDGLPVTWVRTVYTCKWVSYFTSLFCTYSSQSTTHSPPLPSLLPKLWNPPFPAENKREKWTFISNFGEIWHWQRQHWVFPILYSSFRHFVCFSYKQLILKCTMFWLIFRPTRVFMNHQIKLSKQKHKCMFYLQFITRHSLHYWNEN